MMASELISESDPYGLHASMFLVRLYYTLPFCGITSISSFQKITLRDKELLNSMNYFSKSRELLIEWMFCTTQRYVALLFTFA